MFAGAAETREESQVVEEAEGWVMVLFVVVVVVWERMWVVEEAAAGSWKGVHDGR